MFACFYVLDFKCVQQILEKLCTVSYIQLDLFLQASCKKKLHLPFLKSVFFLKGGWGGGGVLHRSFPMIPCYRPVNKRNNTL